MGRPKGSKNRSTLEKVKTPKSKKDVITPEFNIKTIERTEVTKSGDGLREFIVRRPVWFGVPTELKVSESTPEGTRLVVSTDPDTRYFLHKFVEVGKEGFPNGGVSARIAGENFSRHFHVDTVMIHSAKSVHEPLPDHVKHFTGGHRAGTAAAERAARKEARRQAKQKKLADKQAKREAKLAKRLAKKEKKNRKAPPGFKFVKTGKRGRPRKVAIR